MSDDRHTIRTGAEQPASRAREIFVQALRRQTTEDRERCVAEACGDDQELYALVTSLLQAHDQAGEFLEQNVMGDSSEPVSEGPATVIGRYKLLEKIGEGGFGAVYMAEQTEPVHRRVALKIIKLGMDTRQVIVRFEAERQALALMEHPNIAKALDAGATETGRPFFVMELVRGITITDYCDRNRLGARERLALFIQVCNAIQHAHQKGVIHRDLKPSNILVTLHDGVAVPKVIDFGIAKAIEQRLTSKTLFTSLAQFLGTPAYTSPEQAEVSSVDIDTRSDIYSLGVLLYELLTGRTPFDTANLLQRGLDELRQTIREAVPPRPSTRLSMLVQADLNTAARERGTEPPRLLSQVRGDLDWIVMKALEKDRTRRYETANAFALDVQRHLNSEPVRARPPSVAYQFGKWARRHKTAFALASVIALAVTLVAIIALISAARERSNAIQLAAAAARERNQSLQLKETLVRQYLARGQALCDRGKVAAGLHWLVRSLEETPAGNQPLIRVIEENLAAWSRQWAEPEAVLFHGSVAMHGAFCPDSQRVITGREDGVLTAWSIASGEILWQTKHKGKIECVTVSPDGKRVLTASQDGTARLCSMATGELVGPAMDCTSLHQVGFSPDGSRAFAGGGTNAARLYAAETGEPLTPSLQHQHWITGHAFSPDGKLLVTGSADSSARFWNVETGEAVAPVLHHDAHVLGVAFSPDGQKVATGCLDGTVWLWSVSTGERFAGMFRHEDQIRSVAFHPDGGSLLTSSFDGTARLWSTTTGNVIGRSMRHDDRVYAASFSPDGSQVLTAGFDSTARLWSAQTAEPLGMPLRHQDNWVREARFSPDGNHILTTCASSEAYLWPGKKFNPPPPKLGETGRTASAEFSPNGEMIAMADWWGGGEVTFWDAETGSELPPGIVHPQGVWSLRFSPDGRRLITAGRDEIARLWDIRSRQPVGFVLKHEAEVYAVAFSPNGLIATGSFDGTAKIWSATDGSLLRSLEHPDFVHDLTFTSDATLLVTACNDGAVRVWSIETGDEILPPLRQRGSLLTVDISPAGLIATGGRNNIVRFWDMRDGQKTDIVLQHESHVHHVVFSPDGQRLLTASRDSTVRLWSVATGEQIGPSLLRGAYPFECAFSPDGKRVVVTDSPGARLLDVPVFPAQRLTHARLWIEVITRMHMDEHGIVTWLDQNDWRQKSKQLEKVGGRPVR